MRVVAHVQSTWLASDAGTHPLGPFHCFRKAQSPMPGPFHCLLGLMRAGSLFCDRMRGEPTRVAVCPLCPFPGDGLLRA